MNTTTSLSFARAGLAGLLIATCCVTVFAQSTQAPVVVERQRVSLAEHAAVRGTYDLSNGNTLVIGGSAARPMAQLGDAASVRLIKVADQQFESEDGSLRLAFTERANGVVDRVAVSTATGVQVAQR